MQPNLANSRRLCAIRALVLTGQVVACGYASLALGWMLPLVTLSMLFSALAVFTLFCWWRSYQAWPVTDAELFVQLCVDIVAFSAVIFFSGGANNPFISYLLVPLCISAATLPWLYTWLLGALSLGAYSLLLFFYVPLAALSPHQGHGGALNIHILGMWVNFVVSALLISYFVFKMASTLRQRESELALVRERQLQDDQLLAVASLAAGTAHELGTPLSTVEVIVEDLRDTLSDAESREDLEAIATQISQCKAILSNLVNTARDLNSGQVSTCSVAQLIDNAVERWQVTRPERQDFKLAVSPEAAELEVALDGTVVQAILNLLNNAADVSPQQVSLNTTLDSGQLTITVSDRGPGLPHHADKGVVKPFVSTKGDGRGLGLFLSNATADRYGGTLYWRARDGGGSHVTLALPLERIVVKSAK